MASVSVVHKMNVLQQNTTSNEPRREIIILRKQTPSDDILITNPGRKKHHHKLDKEAKTTPQPMAVARRNARERNRVKQVNNGFANLRQHIPSFIAAAFESNTRGGNKKLSKVETLRMAVEYIRSLEDLLALDEAHNNDQCNSTGGSSISSFSPSSSSHPSAYQMLSADEDDLSTNPTPPPMQQQQFQYQIIQNHLYAGDDSENLEPLDDVDDHILSDPSLMDAELEFRGAQDLSILHGDSLSPGMYSEASDASDLKSEEIPMISIKSENALPLHHKSNVLNVMQWWDQQQHQQQQQQQPANS